MISDTPSLLYIHGLNSSALSNKACRLIALMNSLGIGEQLRVPELHHHPRQAMVQLEAAIQALGRPLLVGSSLGGYYATHLAHRHGLKAVLINPAVNPHQLFDGYLGTQQNLYTGERWELTQDHITALAELEVPAPQDPDRIQVWLQTGDETLDYRRAESFYRACALRIQPGGDHSYQGFAEQMPALLSFAGFAPDLLRAIDLPDSRPRTHE
ncbi:alpha/beta fold hydrolase [Pseudomonas cichorii]|uniref:Alpha/beta fold hydrolase n=1 Tax=Pseudomonas lijiangensis TaxID=2995658 RepID=A0ABX8HUK9_9PSED|nr:MULTISPECIES: YqiA/YcfP family alpha/beta fold hydrolase [Pseudomonas syringae group]MBX8500959.1 alpha/beta fold hydrolase [Pseudomonas lijiangensis]MBX8505734.1 alpha/beta fold hydrolase [Pseudomonas lijiangensis]MBX8510627.1 alpha/beta fold hydrolase [Pseudomonas cichorii]MBX8520161.1 alpha/beta fold hydrolase [Pseudomonas cichorii]MBX8525629.1 alpha/beta fold hydrolase [Pseudomonas cichorii]